MTLKVSSLQENPKVVWSNPLGKGEDIDGNELLYEVDEKVFPHRRETPEKQFGNRVKHRYWALMQPEDDGDANWSSHHIADDVDQLRKAIIGVFEEEIEALETHRRARLYENICNLSNPKYSYSQRTWGYQFSFQNLGTLFEALIPYDDPDFDLKQELVDEYQRTLTRKFKELNLSCDEGFEVEGSWRDLAFFARPNAKFQISGNLDRYLKVTYNPPKNNDIEKKYLYPSSTDRIIQAVREFRYAVDKLKKVVVDNILGSFMHDHLTPKMLEEFLSEMDRKIFPHRQELFSHQVKREFWVLSGKPDGDPDWGGKHLDHKDSNLENALRKCFSKELRRFSLSQSWEIIELYSYFLDGETEIPEIFTNLGLFYLIFVPYDAPNRSQQIAYAKSYLQALSRAMEDKKLKLDCYSDRVENVRLEGDWRDAFQAGAREMSFESHCPNIPGHAIYTFTTQVKRSTQRLDFSIMSLHNLDVIGQMQYFLISNMISWDFFRKNVWKAMTDLDLRSKSQDPCVICTENKREWAIIPCGHLSYCEACINTILECSICRGSKERVLEVKQVNNA